MVLGQFRCCKRQGRNPVPEHGDCIPLHGSFQRATNRFTGLKKYYRVRGGSGFIRAIRYYKAIGRLLRVLGSGKLVGAITGDHGTLWFSMRWIFMDNRAYLWVCMDIQNANGYPWTIHGDRYQWTSVDVSWNRFVAGMGYFGSCFGITFASHWGHCWTLSHVRVTLVTLWVISG